MRSIAETGVASVAWASMRAPLLSSLVFTAAVGGLASVTSPAWAAGAGAPTLDVLEVATDDADDQAKALTVAIKARVKASKDYALADGDYSLAVMLAALKCGDVPDPSCQTRIAEKMGSERYVWGTMKKSAGGQVTVDLHLWQKGQTDVKQQFSFSDNLTEPLDPSLQKLADQMLTKLTNFGKMGAARVTSASPVEGELFIDGSSSGKFTNAPGEMTLAIGEHRFEVRSGGKVLAEGNGRVAATGTLEVHLLPPAKGEQTSTGSSGGDWRKTAGYVGVGVGGALIAGGLYSMIKVNGINNDEGYANYRKGFGAQADICQQADNGKTSPMAGAASPSEVSDKCSTGSTFSTLQYVLFPLGGIAAAAGVYFLVTAKPGSEAAAPQSGSVRVIPSLGRSAGSVDVHVTF
jgi:hypothetical protein